MKENTMRILMVLVLVTACSKSEKKQEGSDCEVAAKRGVEVTIAKRRAGNTQPLTPQEQEVPKRLAPALAKTCADDKWSKEVIDCFKTTDDIAKCKAMLTPEQRGAYTRAAIGAMQAAGGMGGGMPPHGMPPHGGAMGSAGAGGAGGAGGATGSAGAGGAGSAGAGGAGGSAAPAAGSN